LKSVDSDLETPATKYCKNVSPLRTNNSTSIQLHVDGACKVIPVTLLKLVLSTCTQP